MCACACGGDRKGEIKFVVQRDSEEEAHGLSKTTSHSRVACQKIRFLPDAAARTHQVRIKWPKWPEWTSQEHKAVLLPLQNKKGSFTGVPPHPLPAPRPSYWQEWQRSHDAPLSLTVKPTSNGRGAVAVKPEKKKGLSKSTELPRENKKRRQSRRQKSLLHTLLSTLLCQNRLSQCVHKPWGIFRFTKKRERKARDRIKNKTLRHESSDLFSLQGSKMLCICLRKNLYFTLWNRRGRKAKKVWWVVMGELGSKIKQNRSSAMHVVSSSWW